MKNYSSSWVSITSDKDFVQIDFHPKEEEIKELLFIDLPFHFGLCYLWTIFILIGPGILEDKIDDLLISPQGMRLPTRKELLKLYNYQVPWRNEGCKSGCSYWSGTSYAMEKAFFVSMIDGGQGWSDKRKEFSSDTSDVLCVK